MDGTDEVCHCRQLLEEQLPQHERWFMGLLFKPLPSELELLHSQRLLLLFFGVLGSDAVGSQWLAARTPTMVDAIVHEVRRCYDAATGGFLSEPSSAYVGVATLTMTHCAVHVLWVVGALEAALSTWLDPKQLRSFVVACRAKPLLHSACTGRAPPACMDGDASTQPPLDEDHCGGFAAFPASSEIDVRFTYSALTILRLASCESEGAVPPKPWGQTAPPAQVYLEMGDVLMAALLNDVQAYLLRCWSPLEGGFGGTPGAEAHGGMTFCAVASLSLLGWWGSGSPESRRVRRHALRYCVSRVGFGPEANEEDAEGEALHWERVQAGIGFQGRPNKPHDTCYTFWLGGALRILEAVEWSEMEGAERRDDETMGQLDCNHRAVESLVDDYRVASFVLSCCGRAGGFGRDDGDVDPLHAALAMAGLASRIPVRHRRVDPTTSRCVGLTDA